MTNVPRSTMPDDTSRQVSSHWNDDALSSLLNDMPGADAGDQAQFIFSSRIQEEVRRLEEKISDAKRSQGEAQAELARLQMVFGAGVTNPQVPMEISTSAVPDNLFPGPELSHGHIPTFNGHSDLINTFEPSFAVSGQALTQSSSGSFIPFGSSQVNPGMEEPLITPFDVEALLRDANLDFLLPSLPDLQSRGPTPPSAGQTMPLTMPDSFPAPQSLSTNPGVSHRYEDDRLNSGSSWATPYTSDSTGSGAAPADQYVLKKRDGQRSMIEGKAKCSTCSRYLARIMFRGIAKDLPKRPKVQWACTQCVPVAQDDEASLVRPRQTMRSLEMRKESRLAMETEDADAQTSGRRIFCDVCQKVIASLAAVTSGADLSRNHLPEVVCEKCDFKYRRCTNCGGGGGARLGVGKWRLKQVFPPGRKTCSLSHNRLGSRPREIGVHVTPDDFTSEELSEILRKCEALWTDKTIARLAVPDVFEIDLPSGSVNPLRDYDEVAEVVRRKWPIREVLLRSNDLDPTRFKRLLGLTWAAKGHRTRASKGDDEDGQQGPVRMEAGFEMMKTTEAVLPPESDLIGMWGAEWDTQHGSLLILFLIPFEGDHGDDSTALSVIEMVTKVQALRSDINEDRTMAARAQGKEPDLLPVCEHLWVVQVGATPVVREKIGDMLIKKRSFVHVDEYLTRHPEFIDTLKTRPTGLHPDLLPNGTEVTAGPDDRTQSRVLVRWLGTEFDPERALGVKRKDPGVQKLGKRKSRS